MGLSDRFEACLVCLCDVHRMRILYALQIAVLGLGVGFFSVSIHASGTCYSSPCVDVRGLQTMWKVDNGLSFLAMASGVCYMLHPLAGVFLLFKKCDHFCAGAFIGLGGALCLASLADSVVWGTRATMMADMSGPFIEGSATVDVNEGALPLFAWLSSIAGTIFALELISLAMLAYALDSISNGIEPRLPRQQYAPDPPAFKSYHTAGQETDGLMSTFDDPAADDNPFQDNPDAVPAEQDHLTI